MDTRKVRPAYQRAENDEIEQPAGSALPVEPSGRGTKESFTSIQITPAAINRGLDSHLPNSPEQRCSSGDRNWRMRFEGWRAGASIAAIIALVSFLINFVVAIWLGSKGSASALVSVYEGSCSAVGQIDIWVHLAIKIVSTLLLGGSNYCSRLSAWLFLRRLHS